MRFFKIGLILARKWKRMNQMSTLPFWWVFREVLESVLRFGRAKCHFLALQYRHFWRKCPFSNAKKWHFERPDLRTDSKNLAKHPQNGGVDIWFMHFHFQANIKPILINCIFFIVLQPFYSLNEAKTKQWLPSLNFGRNSPIIWERS